MQQLDNATAGGFCEGNNDFAPIAEAVIVRKFAAEHTARDPSPSVDARGRICYSPVELLPIPHASLAHGYCTVPAIHDAVCQRTQEINPCPVDAAKEHESGDYSKSIAGANFSVLRSQVKDVSADDRAYIEKYLHVVHADMGGDAPSATCVERDVPRSTSTK